MRLLTRMRAPSRNCRELARECRRMALSNRVVPEAASDGDEWPLLGDGGHAWLSAAAELVAELLEPEC